MASEGEDMLVDAPDPMEGGSRDVDEPGEAEVIFKDMTNWMAKLVDLMGH